MRHTWITHQVEIILDDISLEGLQRQSPIAHSHDERMVDELLPHILDVWSLEEVFDKVAPIPVRSLYELESHTPYGAKGSV